MSTPKNPSQPYARVSFHQMAISIVFPAGYSCTFDPAGRPIRFSFGKQNFVRGSDGTIKEKSWNTKLGEFGRVVRTLPRKEAENLLQKVFINLKKVKHLLTKGAIKFQTNPQAKAGGFNSAPKILRLLLRWDKKRLSQHSRKFMEIYKPQNILPPDQYFSIPIQVAEGCPWNKCSFCHFYKGRRYRIKSWREIKRHIREVKRFLGEGIHLRKSVFLSDANVLALPSEKLGIVMKEIKRQFPDQTGPDGGIFTFGDVPAILGKTETELKKLKGLGLKRVYTGLESGSNLIRQELNKPASQDEAISAVRRLKKAGIKAGIIVLLNDFGLKMNRDHTRETAKTLRNMNLSKGDFIYFSPFKNSDFPKVKQFQQIKKGIRFPGNKPVLAVYDIREFVV